MDRKPKLKTLNRLLNLRNILDQIGQVSWSFSVLNKQYPVNFLTEEQAQELIVSYEDLIKKVISLIENEYGNGSNQSGVDKTL